MENKTYSFHLVKSWGKNIYGGNIFHLDKLFVPINIANWYWVLVFIYVSLKQIRYYDSMKGNKVKDKGRGKRYLKYVSIFKL